MQKNETKDEMLIHSLKQVINLQKKFMPGDYKIGLEDPDTLNESI